MLFSLSIMIFGYTQAIHTIESANIIRTDSETYIFLFSLYLSCKYLSYYCSFQSRSSVSLVIRLAPEIQYELPSEHVQNQTCPRLVACQHNPLPSLHSNYLSRLVFDFQTETIMVDLCIIHQHLYSKRFNSNYAWTKLTCMHGYELLA